MAEAGRCGYLTPEGSLRLLGREAHVIVLSAGDKVATHQVLAAVQFIEVKFVFAMRDEGRSY